MAGPRQSEEATEKKAVARLWEAGADFAGGVAGGFVGTLGGPPGIVLGSVTGVAVARSLRRVGEEVEERSLAPRQHARIGGVWTLAAAEIEQRLAEGEEPRRDDFFEAQGGRRADGEELLEGVLRRAGEEYEELKLPFLAHLYAEISFREEISIGYAHHLLRLFDRISYRQLCILAMLGADSGTQLKRVIAHLNLAVPSRVEPLA